MDTVVVGLLDADSAGAIVHMGADRLRPDDAGRMHHWCGRHAYFLQLFGRLLVDARCLGSSSDEALTDFQSQAAIHFRQMWRAMPESWHTPLRDAARGVPPALGVLRQRGFLTEDGKPFGEVFAAWLRGEIGE